MIISFHLFFSVVVALNSFRLSFLILSFAPSLLSSQIMVLQEECRRRSFTCCLFPAVSFYLFLSLSLSLSLPCVQFYFIVCSINQSKTTEEKKNIVKFNVSF